MVELWRVVDRVQHTPAHLVIYRKDGVVVTACNWAPKKIGELITRAQMLEQQAFPCRHCWTKSLAQ